MQDVLSAIREINDEREREINEPLGVAAHHYAGSLVLVETPKGYEPGRVTHVCAATDDKPYRVCVESMDGQRYWDACDPACVVPADVE